MMSTDTSARNSAFWNELCGTALAKSLGVTDASATSLERFDNWYFSFYPYLLEYVRPDARAGKRVLEIGLGYGSVGQRLAQAGAIYTGLDIAVGPVDMMRTRLTQRSLPGAAVQGDALDCPFEREAFDAVIAIGSLHHTGNLARALSEVHRVLAPSGEALVMVYNAYSYRRWMLSFGSTLRHFMFDRLRFGDRPKASELDRARYDQASDGSAPPATEFVSVAEVRRMTRGWHSISARRENIGAELLLKHFDRNFLNNTFGPFLGLDLYFEFKKK